MKKLFTVLALFVSLGLASTAHAQTKLTCRGEANTVWPNAPVAEDFSLTINESAETVSTEHYSAHADFSAENVVWVSPERGLSNTLNRSTGDLREKNGRRWQCEVAASKKF